MTRSPLGAVGHASGDGSWGDRMGVAGDLDSLEAGAQTGYHASLIRFFFSS